MKASDLTTITKMRLAVSYLGEKDLHGWWGSSFYSRGSSAFLGPLFPRSELLAQCRGASSAALRIHDERIGVGKVFHLFRLPEEIERGIHENLCQRDLMSEFRELIGSEKVAFAFLSLHGVTSTKPGPIREGTLADFSKPSLWSSMASHYAFAIQNQMQVYPYIVDDQ
jgi:hypothetical protein